jgi:hypothetical protein
MKTSLRTSRHFVAFTIISMALLTCASSAGTTSNNAPALSKKQVKAMLATAKTAEDHQRIAEYYREQAQQLSAKAQEFSEHAAYLATQPATIESKQGISCNCTSHYRYFSKIYAQEASDFETKAAQQEQLVQSLGGTPQK